MSWADERNGFKKMPLRENWLFNYFPIKNLYQEKMSNVLRNTTNWKMRNLFNLRSAGGRQLRSEKKSFHIEWLIKVVIWYWFILTHSHSQCVSSPKSNDQILTALIPHPIPVTSLRCVSTIEPQWAITINGFDDECFRPFCAARHWSHCSLFPSQPDTPDSRVSGSKMTLIWDWNEMKWDLHANWLSWCASSMGHLIE